MKTYKVAFYQENYKKPIFHYAVLRNDRVQSSFSAGSDVPELIAQLTQPSVLYPNFPDKDVTSVFLDMVPKGLRKSSSRQIDAEELRDVKAALAGKAHVLSLKE